MHDIRVKENAMRLKDVRVILRLVKGSNRNRELDGVWKSVKESQV